ncbi:hypothetical protein TWF506_004450 [Arthrobotrys conoides]|uniref:Uncharacterized protein n=1 Tax=Arthrobotrys conoides TaxID=74498 RepID=A0AAN8NBQ8_9PEZI
MRFHGVRTTPWFNYPFILLYLCLLHFRGSFAIPLKDADDSTSLTAHSLSENVPATIKLNSWMTYNQTDIGRATANGTLNQLKEDSKGSNEDEKRVVQPDIFFADLKVYCPTEGKIFDTMSGDPSRYPRFRRRKFSSKQKSEEPLTHWISRPEYTQGVRRASGKQNSVRLDSYFRYCKFCACDPETGEILHAPEKPAGHSNPVHGREHCTPGDDLPKMCTFWWNCRCRAFILQPGLQPGQSYAEHLDALERVPRWFKSQNPGYEWTEPVSLRRTRPSWARPRGQPSIPSLLNPFQDDLIVPPNGGLNLPSITGYTPQDGLDLPPIGRPGADPRLFPVPREVLDIGQQQRDLENWGQAGEPYAGPSSGPPLYQANDDRGWEDEPDDSLYYDPRQGRSGPGPSG